jgi:hypothetical protein
VKCIITGVGDIKGKLSLIFQVVVSHTTNIQSPSRMHWGATADSAIYKFDAAVHERMPGIYAIRKFTIWKDPENNITAIELYYIADEGYPKLNFLTPPLNGLKLDRKRIFGETLLSQQEKMLNAVLAFKKEMTLIDQSYRAARSRSY